MKTSFYLFLFLITCFPLLSCGNKGEGDSSPKVERKDPKTRNLKKIDHLGLANFGGCSCSVNAVHKLLWGITDLASQLSTQGNPSPVQTSFIEFLRALENGSDPSHFQNQTRNIIEKVQGTHSFLSLGQTQQDAQEYLMALLEGVNLQDVFSTPIRSATFISDHYSLGPKIEVAQEWGYLIPEAGNQGLTTLQDVIFYSWDRRENYILLQEDPQKAPKYFFVFLKRYGVEIPTGNFIKIKKEIQIPKTVEIPFYSWDSEQGILGERKTQEYLVRGIICHIGENPGAGHSLTYLYQEENDIWELHDDQRVVYVEEESEKVKFKQNISQNSYILLLQQHHQN